MLFTNPLKPQSELRAAITRAYHLDETNAVEQLLQQATLPLESLNRITQMARQLVAKVRQCRTQQGGLDAFLERYDLSSAEGIALMCLAEALLRVPDKNTIDNLIRDKIAAADWAAHLGKSSSSFVNAATWALMLTGKMLDNKDKQNGKIKQGIKSFIERSSLPVIRKAVQHAMKLLGQQFVMGETIEAALKRAQTMEAKGYYFSYDMLGEAARTSQDAERYFKSYQNAIQKIGAHATSKNFRENPGISIKLSALHPRYEFVKHQRVLTEIVPPLIALVTAAKSLNINLTIDAEEADRLDLSLDIFEKVFTDPLLENWEGFGLAVQSYQKRAPYVLDWLIALARKQNKRIPVRLIKGAYWDYEIKNAQVRGLRDYPVFTRKNSTDVSFLACARKIAAATDAIYAQFGTHNAYSVAAVIEMFQGHPDFEFQCLHGMGYTLYDQIVGPKQMNIPCRVYAPVGGHEDLLAYLVRRLLENGANTSFINRNIDLQVPIDDVIADPVAKTRLLVHKPHPQIPLPSAIYPDRKNSAGIDLTDYDELAALYQKMPTPMASSSNSSEVKNDIRVIFDPSDRRRKIGEMRRMTLEQAEQALVTADKAYVEWNARSIEQRAACLEKAGELFQQQMPQLMTLLVREAGKTINDAIAEVRETIDYCRYYAEEARKHLAPVYLPGPTGETNQLQLHGRGVIACISPWNFPLAIFTGQMTAALVAGNAVLAKPAEQTPLVAQAAVRILHAAGVPEEVLHFIPGRGSVVGNFLAGDPRVKGIIFTGSTETARTINKTLADRSGPIPLLIAETGGQNAMIVDSTALPEQVVVDVMTSAFYSAGQRCSALRVLFLQEDIADKMISMLQGAMAELSLGDPALLNTDIGPVIDGNAKEKLIEHELWLDKEAKLIYKINLPVASEYGSFFGPCAYEIKSLDQLKQEIFGPILHVVRYAATDLDKVIRSINNTGYGLTLGIQSRVDATIDYIQSRVQVGNIYVNRNMIGAVVGVQPFGGENLSGTGPKAGGPHYLPRLCVERLLCVNTTAAGGNASLLTLQE